MRKCFLFALASAALLGGAARAQAPAAEVQALTQRLNELIRAPQAESEGEVLVSLADCGVRQTVRKYRTAGHPTTASVNVSSTKKGGSWGVRTDKEVQFELTLSLDWAEIGSIRYAPDQDQKTGRRYYELTVQRRKNAAGKSSAGLADTITFDLNTQDDKEVAELVRRLEAVGRRCQGKKS